MLHSIIFNGLTIIILTIYVPGHLDRLQFFTVVNNAVADTAF